jgi:hypothetical protein
VALLLVVLTGCSGGPRIVRISGTVTRAGKPVPNIVVNFMPEEGRPSWGSTDEQGHYTLHYDRDQDGAVTGRHQVSVEYSPRNPGAEDIEARGGGKPTVPQELQAILQKYGNPETTPLKVEVNKNNQVIDIQLD